MREGGGPDSGGGIPALGSRLGGVTRCRQPCPGVAIFGWYPVDRVIVPAHVDRLAAPVGSLPTVEKIGVFVEEAGPILAVRAVGRWLEVHS